MKFSIKILITNVLLIGYASVSISASSRERIDFMGDTLQFSPKSAVLIGIPYKYEEESIVEIREKLNEAGCREIIHQIKEIVQRKELCDWFTYQLVRQAANMIIPKNTDYLGYTTTKWFLMNQLGFSAAMALSKNGVLLYIKSNDQIYNIPTKIIDGSPYVCFNYHDYNYTTEKIIDQTIVRELNENSKAFSFSVPRLPTSNPQHYVEGIGI